MAAFPRLFSTRFNTWQTGSLIGIFRVAILAVPQKLAVCPDQPVLKVKVRGQLAELGNAKPGSQQDDKFIGVHLCQVILCEVD